MDSKLRRMQLIAPFGVGAIHVLKNGIAVVTGGLDNWFKPDDPHDLAESCRIDESRLQRQLGVSHFRKPPSTENENNLYIPVYRFPTWYVCGRCGKLKQYSLHAQGFLHCNEKNCRNAPLRQVNFVAVCDHGHLQDFPWTEWVHRGLECSEGADGKMIYKAGGVGTLSDIRITCSCGATRTMDKVMAGEFDDDSDPAHQVVAWSGLTTNLTKENDNNDTNRGDYKCQGLKIWLGDNEPTSCNRPLRAVLINATNVHYAQVRSALWLPNTGTQIIDLIRRMLEDDPLIRTYIGTCYSADCTTIEVATKLLKRYNNKFLEFNSQGTLLNLLTQALQLNRNECQTEQRQVTHNSNASSDLELRLPEYKRLSQAISFANESRLVIRTPNISGIIRMFDLAAKIEQVSLVDKMVETRVFNGFSRLLSSSLVDAPSRHEMLWKNYPTKFNDRWLPAVQVSGEGIFIKFTADNLANWEKKVCVNRRIVQLQKRYEKALHGSHRERTDLTPRLVLLHSLSHLLIRRLIFTCGYGSASLRERLYVSTNPETEMCGILIYTASGDSEGSMGGLVRMGEIENLNKLLEAICEDVKWCSSDPVCEEIGRDGGQGVNGLNIAACHSCMLLPETSCELFNCFLDRGLVKDFFGMESLG